MKSDYWRFLINLTWDSSASILFKFTRKLGSLEVVQWAKKHLICNLFRGIQMSLKFLNLNLSHFKEDIFYHQIEIKYIVRRQVCCSSLSELRCRLIKKNVKYLLRILVPTSVQSNSFYMAIFLGHKGRGNKMESNFIMIIFTSKSLDNSFLNLKNPIGWLVISDYQSSTFLYFS